MSGPIYGAAGEKRLMTEIWDPEISENPYNFVKFVFPWGKAGTPLAGTKEPRKWQIDDFLAIADHIKQNKQRINDGQEPKVYKQATVSGRGPGKSAELAMLQYWMLSTNIGSSTIVTANSETQLKTKTFAELGKWHTMAINSHWFDRQAISLKPAEWFGKAVQQQLKIDPQYWYIQGLLWSEENPDAFAGTHNQHGVMVMYDEGSGIPVPIWTVTEGFFARPVLHRYWVVASNGRKNTGAFFECFHKNRDLWTRLNQIDARKVEGAALDVLNGIVAQYGADSDEARVEVYGQFPKQGDKQFMSRGEVEEATTRPLPDPRDTWAPLIMGVDVARYGEDTTVIRFRQGRDARSFPVIRVRGKNNVEVADLVAGWIDKTNPDAVNIDGGNGSGVIDILASRGYRVNEILFGGKASDPRWFNKRTEMWADMREWVRTGCLPKEQRLVDDLVSPEYEYPGNGDRQSLETKEHMKQRGFGSPDDGDALALTFAVKVSRKDTPTSRAAKRARIAPGTNCGIF
jgi:hypothetical protein